MKVPMNILGEVGGGNMNMNDYHRKELVTTARSQEGCDMKGSFFVILSKGHLPLLYTAKEVTCPCPCYLQAGFFYVHSLEAKAVTEILQGHQNVTLKTGSTKWLLDA